ncbi:MAG TPA: ABC transporter permease subunit [Pseudolysinimonas sp.]|nr:ABC transporter permease subunit [Pseudolysinimonas sp.]
MTFVDALAWIFTASHWFGDPGRSTSPAIFQRLIETLQLCGVSVLIACVIAVPLGILIGHSGRGRTAAILVSNVARALPTLGLLSILILLIAVNAVPVVVVLVILGIPPMLAGVYAGFESVNRDTIDAARATGFREWQIITRIEIPLSAGLLVGGLRSTALQIVATSTVAAYFLPIGLGAYLANGIASRDDVQLVAGAILVTALCLLVDGVLAIVQRLVAPRGSSRGATDSATPKNRSRGVRRPTRGSHPIQEGMQS